MSKQALAAARRAFCGGAGEQGLVYEDDGRWFVGKPAGADVTDQVAPLLAVLGLPVDYPPRGHELDQDELFALEHVPLYPPRASHLGELVYAAVWQATMAPRPGCSEDEAPISRVLVDFGGKPRQRHATVLATVATWLGTAVGSALLKHAERLRTLGYELEHSRYQVAWMAENSRRTGVNHGYRTIEFLLAPRDIVDPSPFGKGLTQVPDLSSDDHEVIEHFMRWLASGEGQQFLRRCETVELARSREDAIIRHAQQHLERAVQEAEPA